MRRISWKMVESHTQRRREIWPSFTPPPLLTTYASRSKDLHRTWTFSGTAMVRRGVGAKKLGVRNQSLDQKSWLRSQGLSLEQTRKDWLDFDLNRVYCRRQNYQCTIREVKTGRYRGQSSCDSQGRTSIDYCVSSWNHDFFPCLYENIAHVQRLFLRSSQTRTRSSTRETRGCIN